MKEWRASKEYNYNIDMGKSGSARETISVANHTVESNGSLLFSFEWEKKSTKRRGVQKNITKFIYQRVVDLRWASIQMEINFSLNLPFSWNGIFHTPPAFELVCQLCEFMCNTAFGELFLLHGACSFVRVIISEHGERFFVLFSDNLGWTSRWERGELFTSLVNEKKNAERKNFILNSLSLFDDLFDKQYQRDVKHASQI